MAAQRSRFVWLSGIFWVLLVLAGSCICNGFSIGTETTGATTRQQQQRLRRPTCLFQSTSSTIITTSDAVELKMMEFSKDNVDTTEPPVILLHGLLGSKRNFASLGTSLAAQLKKKRRVLAVDLRNHGENHHDWRMDMSYPEMAMDVLAFMDTQNMKEAVLVGHSMGGKVAKALALLEPDRVAGLVVLDIAPVEYTEKDPNWKAVHDIVQNIAGLSLEKGQTKRDVDVALRSLIEDPALRAFVLTNLDAPSSKACDEAPCWKINMEAIASELNTLAGFDVPTNQQYAGDTFFIHGGQSKFVRHAYMETLQQYFPNHMLTTIRGAGHWVHAEAPDDTLALLKRYLDR